jgi:hypothetical protein
VAGQFDQARTLWIDALAKFEHLNERELTHLAAMRGAVAYAIAMCEAQLGLPTASRWVERLEHDPSQRVGALHLRKVLCLQQGDWSSAAELQRQMEVLSLQTRTPPMFRELLVVELGICAKARDLTGAQQVLEQIKVLAARYPGWLPSYLVGEAYVRAIAGDHAAAREQFERCIELTQPDARDESTGMPAWIAACAGLTEALIMLQRPEEARDRATAALRVCEAQSIDCLAFELSRALALAEAKRAGPPAAVRVGRTLHPGGRQRGHPTELVLSRLRLEAGQTARASPRRSRRRSEACADLGCSARGGAASRD